VSSTQLSNAASAGSRPDTGGSEDDFAAAFTREQVASRTRDSSPVTYRAADRFWRCAQEAGALTPRMKELVLLALHATVTSLHADGVRRHVARALEAGATEQDILDVLITIVGAANHALYFAVPVLLRELELANHPDAVLPGASAEADAVKAEFIRSRGFWNAQRDVIVRLMPDYFSALSQLTLEPWQKGTLTAKERELVCIAIDSTVTHMYEPGLVIHIRQAVKNGATRQEILEVFHLVALTGLEGYIIGAEALFALAESRTR
jgi:alkylhydroperoxidase/carboxymuconolactone decarboxylase family protein YurZ